MIIRLAVAALVLGSLAACTSGHTSTAPSPAASTSPTSAAPTAPVESGPTIAAYVASCPYVSASVVLNTLGQRLGRISVLRSGGKVVGCRLYPLAHPDAGCGQDCFDGEHLPGPKQPVLEVTTYRYATHLAAYNAFVLLSRAGTEAATVTIATGVPGIAYRTRFDPTDGATDWACGFADGTTRVLIRTDENDSMDEARDTARIVFRAL